jgi:hypothetical protein
MSHQPDTRDGFKSQVVPAIKQPHRNGWLGVTHHYLPSAVASGHCGAAGCYCVSPQA